MTQQIPTGNFTSVLFDLLDETFEQVHGMYLDKGTSLLTTLATISAAEASQPVGGKCATLAAQVAHVCYYLDVLEKHMLQQEVGQVDWNAIWRTVHGVTATEWTESQARLQATYQRVRVSMDTLTWSEDEMGAALCMVVHTAYHLGEIRQALCILQK